MAHFLNSSIKFLAARSLFQTSTTNFSYKPRLWTPNESSSESQQYRNEGYKGQNTTDIISELQSLSLKTNVLADIIRGAASKSFSKEITDILSVTPPDDMIEVKRLDGQLYVKPVFYHRILSKAFGVGGWCILPITAPTIVHNTDDTGIYIREYALICDNRYVSQSFGEGTIFARNVNSGVTAANELSKQIALSNCCKELGIGEIINVEEFLVSWRGKYAEQVMCENSRTHEQKFLWRRKFSETAFSFPWIVVEKAKTSQFQDQTVSSDHYD